MNIINLSNKELTKLPNNLPRKVEGSFYCSHNKFTTLKGSPQKVEGDFWCIYNKLISLEGSPKEVLGDFWCSNNNLTILEIIKGLWNCEIEGDIYTDFVNFDFKKFFELNNYEKIKMLFKGIK